MIGHILRKDRNDDCNFAMSWAPEGKRRKGRPKTTWRHTLGKKKEKRQVGTCGRKCGLQQPTRKGEKKKLCEGPMRHEAREG